MGTGLTTILLYGLCGGVVAFTMIVGLGLFMWGTHKEKRRRRAQPPS
jgi:hypothetical protein